MKTGSSELEVELRKLRLEQAEIKAKFDKEAKEPENSKAEGQPLRFDLEQVMKEHGGIDFASFHGRELQGPACRAFLEYRDEILDEILKYVTSLPVEK
jgi:hypothetical protein